MASWPVGRLLAVGKVPRLSLVDGKLRPVRLLAIASGPVPVSGRQIKFCLIFISCRISRGYYNWNQDNQMMCPVKTPIPSRPYPGTYTAYRLLLRPAGIVERIPGFLYLGLFLCLFLLLGTFFVAIFFAFRFFPSFFFAAFFPSFFFAAFFPSFFFAAFFCR
jgi:hypothetical protein